MNTKDLAMKIATFASDKKANDILLLNMEGLSPVTDYFVICSASNNMLVKAIADNKAAIDTINDEATGAVATAKGYTDEEIKNLENWLFDNEDLIGVYPFDEIESLYFPFSCLSNDIFTPSKVCPCPSKKF